MDSKVKVLRQTRAALVGINKSLFFIKVVLIINILLLIVFFCLK
jgi:hypothetical protein